LQVPHFGSLPLVPTALIPFLLTLPPPFFFLWLDHPLVSLGASLSGPKCFRATIPVSVGVSQPFWFHPPIFWAGGVPWRFSKLEFLQLVLLLFLITLPRSLPLLRLFSGQNFPSFYPGSLTLLSLPPSSLIWEPSGPRVVSVLFFFWFSRLFQPDQNAFLPGNCFRILDNAFFFFTTQLTFQLWLALFFFTTLVRFHPSLTLSSQFRFCDQNLVLKKSYFSYLY